MRRSRLLAATAGGAAVASFSTWLLAAESRGPLPAGDFAPRKAHAWTLTGTDAAAVRRDALRRASVRVPDGLGLDLATRNDSRSNAEVATCRFLRAAPTGTSAKFDCVLDGGDVVKVKYSRNPEIHAEVAATRLVSALGFAADHVDDRPAAALLRLPALPVLHDAAARGGRSRRDHRRVRVRRRLHRLRVGRGRAQVSRAGDRDPDARRVGVVGAATIRRRRAPRSMRFGCSRSSSRTGTTRRRTSGSSASTILRLTTAATPSPASTRRAPRSRPRKEPATAAGADSGPRRHVRAQQGQPRALARAADLDRSRGVPCQHARTCRSRAATFPDADDLGSGPRASSAAELAALSDADVRGLFAAARFPDYPEHHRRSPRSRRLDRGVPPPRRSDPHRRPVSRLIAPASTEWPVRLIAW